MKVSILFSSILLLAGCTTVPSGIKPVRNFEIERYLGTWYEIARLDHRFERGLSRVSANYSKRPDGGIDVLNRGYNKATGEWKNSVGRAYLLNSAQTASLKVTFFWPFYAGYHVIELDQKDYSYALVSGPDRDYLWILSRTPKLDKTVIQKLVDKASELGFVTDDLIFVEQHD